jgi:hypothetical protein
VTRSSTSSKPLLGSPSVSRALAVALAAGLALSVSGCRKLANKLRGDSEEPAPVAAEPAVEVAPEVEQQQVAAQPPEPGAAESETPSPPADTPTPPPVTGNPGTPSPGERALVPRPEPTADPEPQPTSRQPTPANPPDGGRSFGSIEVGERVERPGTRTETPTGEVRDRRIRRRD